MDPKGKDDHGLFGPEVMMNQRGSLDSSDADCTPSNWTEVPLSFRPARVRAYLTKADRIDVRPVAQTAIEQIAAGQFAEAERLLGWLEEALERTQGDEGGGRSVPSLLLHARGLAALPTSFPPALRRAIAHGIALGRVELAKQALTRHRWLHPFDGPVTVAMMRRYANATAESLIPKNTGPEVSQWVKAACAIGMVGFFALKFLFSLNRNKGGENASHGPRWTEPIGMSALDGATYAAKYLEERGAFESEPELENAAAMLWAGLGHRPLECALLRGEVTAVKNAAYRGRSLSTTLGPIRYLEKAGEQLCPGPGSDP